MLRRSGSASRRSEATGALTPPRPWRAVVARPRRSARGISPAPFCWSAMELRIWKPAPRVDAFAAYTGVVHRAAVAAGADVVLSARSLAPVLALAATEADRERLRASPDAALLERASRLLSSRPPPRRMNSIDSSGFGRFFLPGPTEVRPEVLQAMARPTIGHRGTELQALLRESDPRLRAVFGTSRPVYVATASATGLMEAAVRCGVRRRALLPGERRLQRGASTSWSPRAARKRRSTRSHGAKRTSRRRSSGACGKTGSMRSPWCTRRPRPAC